MRVIIAGGGIGGLTLAHGLARSGAEVRVIEAARGRTGSGTGITLLENALRALDRIGLADPVVATGSGWDRRQHAGARRATVLHEQVLPKAYKPGAPPATGIMRTASRRPARGARDGERRVDRRSTTTIEQHRAARRRRRGRPLRRRAPARYDLLVAADGAYSRTRARSSSARTAAPSTPARASGATPSRAPRRAHRPHAAPDPRRRRSSGPAAVRGRLLPLLPREHGGARAHATRSARGAAARTTRAVQRAHDPGRGRGDGRVASHQLPADRPRAAARAVAPGTRGAARRRRARAHAAAHVGRRHGDRGCRRALRGARRPRGRRRRRSTPTARGAPSASGRSTSTRSPSARPSRTRRSPTSRPCGIMMNGHALLAQPF